MQDVKRWDLEYAVIVRAFNKVQQLTFGHFLVWVSDEDLIFPDPYLMLRKQAKTQFTAILQPLFKNFRLSEVSGDLTYNNQQLAIFLWPDVA